jgi:hypothetical protein
VHAAARLAAALFPFSHRPSSARERFSIASASAWMAGTLSACSRSALSRAACALAVRLLAPFALLFPNGLLAPALGIAPLLQLLELGGGLSGVPFADFGSGSLRRLRAMIFPPSPVLARCQV